VTDPRRGKRSANAFVTQTPPRRSHRLRGRRWTACLPRCSV